MQWLKVPYDREWNDSVCPLWRVGFEMVLVDESDLHNGIVYFTFETDPDGSQWDDYNVIVNVKKRTIKGHGSKRHRNLILDKVLYWYLKAKNEEEFEDLLS